MSWGREQVVAVFEQFADQGEMVRLAVGLSSRNLNSSLCCQHSDDPEAIRTQLVEAGADLVVWDVSPVTTDSCRAFERLLTHGTFDRCGVVVTTTHAPKLTEYLGAARGNLRILQKPYDLADLMEELERLSGHRGR